MAPQPSPNNKILPLSRQCQSRRDDEESKEEEEETMKIKDETKTNFEENELSCKHVKIKLPLGQEASCSPFLHLYVLIFFSKSAF